MITFSSNIISVLQQPLIESFHLVRIGSYRTCSYFRDITLSSGEVFPADGNLLGVDPPQTSSVVDKNPYNLLFADPEMVYGGYAEEGLTGQIIEVGLCFVNQATKSPYTNVADIILAYKGKVSATSYQIDTNLVGSSAFIVEGSSPMSDLDLVKAFYTSKSFLNNLDMTDTSFDQVYEGAGPVNLRWGKN